MLQLSPDTRVVALDLETTGLSSTDDRIVELAAVSWQDGRETGAFAALVNPGRPMPPEVIAVHGITDAMVRDQPPIADVLPAFLDFCRADMVVAHNAPFDLGFLRVECARCGLTLFTSKITDTCGLARQRMPGSQNYRLETLAAGLGRGEKQAHRALQDARDCLALYLHCLEQPTPALGRLNATALPHLELLRAAIRDGETLLIEYQDGRGRTTRREIRPTLLDEGCLVVEAFCLLRQSIRHFHLNRITSASRLSGAAREI